MQMYELVIFDYIQKRQLQVKNYSHFGKRQSALLSLSFVRGS